MNTVNTLQLTVGRLRNLTTDILHSKMQHVYEDFEVIVGEKGLMTHMLPKVSEAVKPWLRAHPQLQDPAWWDDAWRTDLDLEAPLELTLPTEAERQEIWRRFAALPSLLFGKKVLVVTP